MNRARSARSLPGGSKRHPAGASIALWLLTAACGDGSLAPDAGSDAGVPVDAGSAVDAGTQGALDAHVIEGGSPPGVSSSPATDLDAGVCVASPDGNFAEDACAPCRAVRRLPDGDYGLESGCGPIKHCIYPAICYAVSDCWCDDAGQHCTVQSCP